MARKLELSESDQILVGKWTVSIVGVHGVDRQVGDNGTAFQRLGWAFGRLNTSGGQLTGVSCNVKTAFVDVEIDETCRTIMGKLREGTPLMTLPQPDPDYIQLVERREAAERAARAEALRRPYGYGYWRSANWWE